MVRNIADPWKPGTIQVRPHDLTTIMAFRGELLGSPSHTTLESVPDNMACVFGFTNDRDAIVWSLDVPEAGKYALSLICRTTEEGNEYEFSANGVTLRGSTVNTLPDPHSQLKYRRVKLEGTIPLAKGVNRLTFRFTNLSDSQVHLAESELAKGGHGGIQNKGSGPCSFRLWSIELVQPHVLQMLQDRAASLRSDPSWMVEGRYGIFIHWSPLSWPLTGPKLSYAAATDMFDVEAFADMVEETGAAWVIFTTTHGPQYFPAPIEAIERILPGHTTKRDLIAEIAAALHQRNIRLMLYYHTSVGEMPAYRHVNKSQWFDDLCSIHQEINERYGERVAGWFIDDAHKWIYPTDFPWERLTRALKAGNPQRLIAFNPGTRPSVTLFGDLLASDNHAHLREAAATDLFAPDGQYANLLQHYSFTLEPGRWALVNRPADGEWPKPAHSAQQLADYVQACAAANVPLTMNMLISQDVTSQKPFVNPETLELMRHVRRVIRL